MSAEEAADSYSQHNLDDIWNQKSSDDFLRYMKFEANNYGFLGANLILSEMARSYFPTNNYSVQCMLIMCFLNNWIILLMFRMMMSATSTPFRINILRVIYVTLQIAVAI